MRHHIFHRAATSFAPELHHTINCSIENRHLRRRLEKHAQIKPLLKKPSADPTELKNFRPISLFSFPAKVIEKAIYAQLSEFIARNHVLDISQSGFRSNHSTETELLAATDNIYSLLDQGKTAALM